MQLSRLVLTSQRVKATRKRKEKVAHLAECLRASHHDEIGLTVCLLSGELPTGKIGLGYAKVMAARGVPPAGESSLTVAEVVRDLERIRDERGAGSAGRRMGLLTGLLERSTAEEQEFLSRLIVGELRHGALEALMEEAIAVDAEVPASAVRRAQMLAADLAEVARVARGEGEAGLRRFDLVLFSPVQPMLAQTAETSLEAIDKLGRCLLDRKLDGARVQVHKQGHDVRVFTRRLNDVTAAVPELVATVAALPARELVLDGETLALAEDGRPRPFQVTMRRFGRRLDVDEMRQSLPLSTFFFDCLYLDGQSLIDAATTARLEAMQSVLPESLRVPSIVTEDPLEASRFLSETFEQGHEGAMAKALDASYSAGRRGAAWLKLKQAHTFDLVVLAAEWGSGRRKGWLSNLHLGARDPASGQFVMVGKTFKGLTDKTLKWQTEALLARKTEQAGHVVHVRPELVVEIALNDVQTSPHYPAGIALRFARVKGYREDKPAAEADTLDALRALHVET